MPSFLNKVFGYKKHDDKEPSRPSREPSDSTLLDGKYEAISPVVSPSAITFAEAQSNRDAERDASFSIFRPKHRGVSQRSGQKRPEAVPQLTLHLPGPKENLDSRVLGVTFEADPDTQLVLDDAVIGAKRLSPLEALVLIRACAQAITERGLETLGIMHPHWFSASPDVQRKLISLFIHSLNSQSRITTLSPTPTSPATAFENELHYTRSPHDVAAVLRWGLRHLSLENDHFGKDSAEWAWYNTFFNAERDASYPLGGFSQQLLPHLPASHIELLVTTLALFSSLASHAETNSISGSKLSKFLGLWLLATFRSEQSDDWDRFYARWERAGRILEHLFLARLRDESLSQRLPTRLQELIKYYPYNKGSSAAEQDLLSRPRFSTVQYDALFVRVESFLTHNAEQPRQHPVQLIADALQLPTNDFSGNEFIELWNAIKAAASKSDSGSFGPEGPQFTRIFADETIQLLSLIPADSSVPTSPVFLTSPILSPKRSSSSLAKIIENVSKPRKSNGSTAVSPTSPTTPMVTDWAQFSMGGFGETPATQSLSALFDVDDDVEVTRPLVSRNPNRKHGTSRTRRRRSEDNDISTTPSTQQLSEPDPAVVETKLASVHIIQIDEAFIDFWSDAIVDPISADWPTFAICALKVTPNAEKPIRWLVVEQIYTREEPAPPPRVPSPETGARGRSPRPSFRSDISGFRISNMFSSARKRFSVLNKSATELTLRKSTGPSPNVGEFGEVVAEEEPSTPTAAQGSNRLEIALGTPTTINGSTTGESTSTPIITPAKPFSPTADIPADQTPTTASALDVKGQQLEHERVTEPSTESEFTASRHAHGDVSADQASFKPSEQVVTTPVEVVSQSSPVAPESVEGSLVLVASTSTVETARSGVPREVTEAQVHVAVETAVVVTEIVPVVEDDAPESVVVGETRVSVQVEEQVEKSTVVVAVEVPAVEVAEEISESVVLVETPVPEVVVRTSEPVVLAAIPDPEPVEEKVVEEPQASVQVEEPSKEQPELVETPAVEAVSQPEVSVAQDAVIVETEIQSAPEASVLVIQAPREVAQETEVATPAPETVVLVEETPGPETHTCGEATQPEPEVVAAAEQVAPEPEPEQLVEEILEPVVEEPKVVVAQEPEPEPVAVVEEVTPEPEQLEETPEPVVEEPEAVVVEEPSIELVVPVPELVVDETIEAQSPEPAQEAVVEELSVEAAPAQVVPVVVAVPEPVVAETPEPVIEEVQAPVEEEASQDAVARPAEERSGPESEAVDDVLTAPAAEEVVVEVIVVGTEAQQAPDSSVPEPVPAVVAELEPAVEEAPEPVIEEAHVHVEAEEPVPAEVPSPEPVTEEAVEEVEAAEHVPEATAAKDTTPEAVNEAAAPEPVIDVVESEPVEDNAAAPIAEEEAAPVVAEEVAVVEASEPVVVAEPVEDEAPKPIVEEVATEEVEVAIIAEAEPVDDKVPEPVAEEESAPIVVEESASPDVAANEPTVVAESESAEGKAEQEVATEVVAVEPAAEPEPDAVGAEVEAVHESQEVAEEPEPAPPVVETAVLVEEDAAPETAPETIEPAAHAPEPKLSEEHASEPVGEVGATAEAQKSSEELILAVPSQEVEPTVPPVEVEESVKVPKVSAVRSETEAVPFVEDEDVEDPLVEDRMSAGSSVPEVIVLATEPRATTDDATPKDA